MHVGKTHSKHNVSSSGKKIKQTKMNVSEREEVQQFSVSSECENNNIQSSPLGLNAAFTIKGSTGVQVWPEAAANLDYLRNCFNR